MSLNEKRKEHNQKVQRQSSNADERLRDLEAEVLRLIDLALEQERTIELLENSVTSLTRAVTELGKRVASSSVD